MALSSHIKDLITAYKAMPNGYRRNKINSHLEDALAHAQLLEQEDPRFHSPAEDRSLDATAPTVCRCPAYPAAQSRTCPKHGSGVA